MAVCGLTTGNVLRLAPVPAIAISCGTVELDSSRPRLLVLGDGALVNPPDDLRNRTVGGESVTYLKELGEGNPISATGSFLGLEALP